MFGQTKRVAADYRFLDKALPRNLAFGKGPTRMLERNGALLMMYWFREGYAKPQGLVIQQREATTRNPMVQALNIWGRRPAPDAIVHAELVRGGRVTPLGPQTPVVMASMVNAEIQNWFQWANTLGPVGNGGRL
jgi:hypothetical protein